MILRQTANNNEKKWFINLTVDNYSELSTSSFQNIEHIVKGEYGSSQSTVRTGPIKMGEKKIISTLVYSNDGEYAYIETEKDLLKIPNNDLVYLFSIELQ